MRSSTFSSSFRAGRHATRGIPHGRKVTILNSREIADITREANLTRAKLRILLLHSKNITAHTRFGNITYGVKPEY